MPDAHRPASPNRASQTAESRYLSALSDNNPAIRPPNTLCSRVCEDPLAKSLTKSSVGDIIRGNPSGKYWSCVELRTHGKSAVRRFYISDGPFLRGGACDITIPCQSGHYDSVGPDQLQQAWQRVDYPINSRCAAGYAPVYFCLQLCGQRLASKSDWIRECTSGPVSGDQSDQRCDYYHPVVSATSFSPQHSPQLA